MPKVTLNTDLIPIDRLPELSDLEHTNYQIIQKNGSTYKIKSKDGGNKTTSELAALDLSNINVGTQFLDSTVNSKVIVVDDSGTNKLQYQDLTFDSVSALKSFANDNIIIGDRAKISNDDRDFELVLGVSPEAGNTYQGMNIDSAVSGAYWKVLNIGPIPATWFGVVGDCTENMVNNAGGESILDATDDSSALQAAIDYCKTYGLDLYLPDGFYRIDVTAARGYGIAFRGKQGTLRGGQGHIREDNDDANVVLVRYVANAADWGPLLLLEGKDGNGSYTGSGWNDAVNTRRGGEYSNLLFREAAESVGPTSFASPRFPPMIQQDYTTWMRGKQWHVYKPYGPAFSVIKGDDSEITSFFFQECGRWLNHQDIASYAVAGTSTDTALKSGATTNVKLAAKFTQADVSGVSTVAQIRGAAFRMRKEEDFPSGATLTLTIEADSSGVPSGTALATGTITVDSSDLDHEYQLVFIDFASTYETTVGTTYWLTITGDQAADATDNIVIESETLGSGGNSASHDGTSWTADATKSLVFQTRTWRDPDLYGAIEMRGQKDTEYLKTNTYKFFDGTIEASAIQDLKFGRHIELGEVAAENISSIQLDNIITKLDSAFSRRTRASEFRDILGLSGRLTQSLRGSGATNGSEIRELVIYSNVDSAFMDHTVTVLDGDAFVRQDAFFRFENCSGGNVALRGTTDVSNLTYPYLARDDGGNTVRFTQESPDLPVSPLAPQNPLPPRKFSGVEFDGSSPSRLVIPGNAHTAIGTGDFWVEFRVKLSQAEQAFLAFYDSFSGAANAKSAIYLRSFSSGILYAEAKNSSGTKIASVATSIDLDDYIDTPIHVVYQRSGELLTVFIDGEQILRHSHSGWGTSLQNTNIEFGRLDASSAEFYGELESLRFGRGNLTGEQIVDLYQEGVLPELLKWGSVSGAVDGCIFEYSYDTAEGGSVWKDGSGNSIDAQLVSAELPADEFVVRQSGFTSDGAWFSGVDLDVVPAGFFCTQIVIRETSGNAITGLSIADGSGGTSLLSATAISASTTASFTPTNADVAIAAGSKLYVAASAWNGGSVDISLKFQRV